MLFLFSDPLKGTELNWMEVQNVGKAISEPLSISQQYVILGLKKTQRTSWQTKKLVDIIIIYHHLWEIPQTLEKGEKFSQTQIYGKSHGWEESEKSLPRTFPKMKLISRMLVYSCILPPSPGPAQHIAHRQSSVDTGKAGHGPSQILARGARDGNQAAKWILNNKKPPRVWVFLGEGISVVNFYFG